MAIDLSRRAFLGSMGMGAAGLAAGAGSVAVVNVANAEETTVEAAGEQASFDNEWSGPGSASGDWTGTPEPLKSIGLSTMPDDELAHRRELYVNAQTARTCEDGTVIPEVYVKFRALLNTYGHGVGQATDTSFVAIMNEVSEDEAQAYLEMPRGHQFSALEFSAQSGRSLEECEQYCESLHKSGWISKTEGSRGVLYGQIAFLYGIEENHTPALHEDPAYAGAFTGTYGSDGTQVAYGLSGTPFFITTPVCKEAVKDGAINPLDDMFALLDTKEKFAVSPCPCRTLGIVNGGPVHIEGCPGGDYDIKDMRVDACGHYLETCLVLGEEAEFWIDLGVGREISREEAKQLLQRSVDDGMILQRIPTKEAENICSCHGDCCGILSCWKMVNTSESRTFKQISRYELEVDTDACIGCGACVERCPMSAVSLGEDGKAELTDACFRCGQCTLTCPAGARILVPRPEDEIMPIFEDIYEMNNRMAAERFESGLIL